MSDVPQSAHTVEAVIPLHAEVAHVGTQPVETGRVRIIKTVRQDEYEVERPLAREHVSVERVAVNRFIQEPPPVRHEGDTMIVPIIEEVLVVEKRLMLKEELHITRTRTVEPHVEHVTLRTEEASVQRVPPPDEVAAAAAAARGST